MKRNQSKLLLGLVAMTLLSYASSMSGLHAADQEVGRAEERYQRTDYEGSLALLQKSESASANFLIGRDYFMLGEWKQATDYLQRAVTAAPNHSDYMDWLGRTYGRRAEAGNPLAAPVLAIKARQAFERAVELDPKNSDALGDLFEYYLEAPGFLGGGYDKAEGVARKISVADPSEGYFAQARLAEKRKEFSTAEMHLRQSVAAAPHAVGHKIALARFLADQGRNRESDDVFREAQKEGPDGPRLWFARADLLIKQKRDLAEAKALLEKYMHAQITVDDPPKQQAARLLKQAGGV